MVKGVNVPNSFHMEIYVHNSATQDMELIARFSINELRQGRKKVEMFNLIGGILFRARGGTAARAAASAPGPSRGCLTRAAAAF